MFGDYIIGHDLGAGHFGRVKLAQHAHTGEYVAVKIIDLAALKPSQVAKIEREVVCMSGVDHPNVAKLLDYNTTTTYDGFPAAVLTIEYAERGELFDFMAHTGAFEDALARTYIRQLFSAVAACHACGIYHRDIKPENLLIDHHFQLKLADFGLAIQLDEDSEGQLLKTECGSQGYMAPEVIAHMPYDGAKADSWSASVVSFVILTGNPPFRIARRGDWWFDQLDANNYTAFWRVHLRASPHVTEASQAFLNRLLVTNTDHRMTAEEVLEDDWLTGDTYHPDELCARMTERYARIEAAKERERQAARARADAMRSRRGGRGGGQFDGFAASVARGLDDAPRYNSIQPSAPAAEAAPTAEAVATSTTTRRARKEAESSPAASSSTAVQPSVPLSSVLAVTDTYSSCYIPEQPRDAVTRLRETLEKLSIRTAQADDFRLSCSVPDTEEEEGVEFYVQVYRDDSDPELQGCLSYAKFVRTAGSYKKLSACQQQLKQQLDEYYTGLLSSEEVLPDPPAFEML